MMLAHVVNHGLFFAAVATGYLFLLMVLTSPRVWGYADYPDAVKRKVPAQTPKEKRLAAVLGLPWFAFVLIFPVLSTYALKSKLGGEIPFPTAFLNLGVMYVLATIGDLIILDWLVISKITPKFVVIPGSTAADYKDFSYHFRGHARAAVIMLFMALVFSAVVSFW